MLRWSCVVLALIAIAAAAFLLIGSEQQLSQQTAALRAFDQHAHDASAALVDARVAQQAYVAAGQDAAFWIVATHRPECDRQSGLQQTSCKSQ